MEDHRRNAWHGLGATPLTAGGALAVGWLIAVDSHVPRGRPSYWGEPSFVAMGLIVIGFIIIGLIMTETWPFGFRRSQHAGSVTVRRVAGYLPEEEPLLVKPPGWTATPDTGPDSKRRVKSLSDVSREFESADNSMSDVPEIPVDYSALQSIHRPLRYDEITEVLRRANPDDWVVLPELVTEERAETVLALRDDLTVTLALFDDGSVKDFDEPWVPAYHTPQPRLKLELRDHGLVVVSDYVVELDGGRWYCPLPRRAGENEWILEAADDRLGAMLNGLIANADVHGWEGRKAQVAQRVQAVGGTFTVQ